MSNNNVTHSTCQHVFFSSNLAKSKSKICSRCGVLSYNNIIMTKPRNYNFSCEFDTSHTLERIKLNLKEKILKDGQGNTEYLNRRTKVLEYLRRLSYNYRFSKKTFNMAMTYTDSILANNTSENSEYKLKFDLTSIGCLLLAVKFIENDPCVPNFGDFMNPRKEFYFKNEICDSEKICLRSLGYKLDTLSAYETINFFLISGLVSLVNASKQESIDLQEFYSLSEKILDYFNEDARCLNFSISEITLGCIVLAAERTSQKISKKVKYNLYKIYGINTEDYNNALYVIRNIYPNFQEERCDEIKITKNFIEKKNCVFSNNTIGNIITNTSTSTSTSNSTSNKLPNINEHLSPKSNLNLNTSFNKIKFSGIYSIPIKNTIKEFQSTKNSNAYKDYKGQVPYGIINPPNMIANSLNSSKFYSSNLSNLQKKIAVPQIQNIKFFSSKKINYVNATNLNTNCSLPSTKNNSRKTSTRTSDDSCFIEISNESSGH